MRPWIQTYSINLEWSKEWILSILHNTVKVKHQFQFQWKWIMTLCITEFGIYFRDLWYVLCTHSYAPFYYSLTSKRFVLDPHTLGFLTKVSFTPLLYHPGGCLGCPEKRTSSRNYNYFVWFAVFQPKWSNIKKSYKNHQNS